MPQSTAKKQLLQQQFHNATPLKRIVARQINSWMETNQKQPQQLKCVAPRFKITRKLPPKQHSTRDQSDQKENYENFQDLKKRKDDLMKSLSNKKWINQNTKANSIENGASANGQKKSMQWFMKLPLVHVNEFVVDQKRQFQEQTTIPNKKQPKICSSVTTKRKSSLRKIDRKQKQNAQKTAYCHYLETKKRNASVEVSKVEEKLGKSRYKNMLTAISRKTSNILITLKIERDR